VFSCFDHATATTVTTTMVTGVPASASPVSFTLLKREPMVLAQEERVGRNPYFIRTPPLLRRDKRYLSTAIEDSNMDEDELIW